MAIDFGMSISFTLMGILISAVDSSLVAFGEYLWWFAMFFFPGMGAVMFDEDVNNIFVKQTSQIVQGGRSLLSPITGRDPTFRDGGIVGGVALGSSLGFMGIPCVLKRKPEKINSKAVWKMSI